MIVCVATGLPLVVVKVIVPVRADAPVLAVTDNVAAVYPAPAVGVIVNQDESDAACQVVFVLTTAAVEAAPEPGVQFDGVNE